MNGSVERDKCRQNDPIDVNVSIFKCNLPKFYPLELFKGRKVTEGWEPFDEVQLPKFTDQC